MTGAEIIQLAADHAVFESAACPRPVNLMQNIVDLCEEVADREREECAKIAEEIADKAPAGLHIAAAIRARGKA